jgi:uncharacterized protein (DUF1499 family)
MFSIFPADKPPHSDIKLRKDIQNPLKPCPPFPNCARRSYHISPQPKVLFPIVLITLKEMDACIVDNSEDDLRAETVFSIFIFKDDVSISLEAEGNGSLLHIRSASRIGKYDFGVNRRRVNRFMGLLGENL